MKIDARRLQGLLRDPGAYRAILLYGDDVGLIRNRAEGFVRSIVGSLDDVFRVATLERDTHDRLAEEATALALTGGRRVVRVREVVDSLTAPVQKFLDGGGEALLVLEAPGLTSTAKLRALADKHEQVAALGCYPEEGRALEATIRTTLADSNVQIDQDALDWAASRLGADQAQTRTEVEKLVLYVNGAGGRVDQDAVEACIGDAAALSVDDALFAATRGDIAAADRAIGLALAEGMSPVAILRAGLMHMQRLFRARAHMANGGSASDAMKSVRPPVFFKRQADFTRALTLWSPAGLTEALSALFAAEQACKRTGAPMDIIGTRAILAIAGRAAQARR